MLYLMQEKSRGEESPWHTFFRDIRVMADSPKKKAAKKNVKRVVSGKKRKAPSTQQTKPESSLETQEATSPEPEGEWAIQADLPLLWSTGERSLLGADFESTSGLRYLSASIHLSPEAEESRFCIQ